jgi:aminoglycoside phosphotransferase (APT) family kinase protein
MAEQETFRDAVIRLRRAPSAAQLAQLRDAVAPGGRVVRVRRLPGGLQCGMHGVDLMTASSERLRLVVRRYTPQQAAGDPGVCRREWETLRLLERAAGPAPRPIYLDGEGAIFGTPTLVMTRLPGRAFVSFPAEIDPWIEQFARALAAIHGADVTGSEAAHLPRFTGMPTAATLEPGPETDRRIAALPRGEAILRVLRDLWPPALSDSPVLLHGDFFTGNTVWNRGRLSGVVDWGDAMLGPREVDVNSARFDLALLGGPHAGDRFLARYEEMTGYRTQNMPLWGLIAAWYGAPLLDLWWEALSYGQLGITREELGARFNSFALDALTLSSKRLPRTAGALFDPDLRSDEIDAYLKAHWRPE